MKYVYCIYIQRTAKRIFNFSKTNVSKIYRRRRYNHGVVNKNKIVEMFMDSTINYTDQILTKQDVFFHNTRDMLSDNIDMYVLWNSVTDQDTKMYIWMYIQQLFFMGSTIIDIDPQLRQIIENFSKSC